MKVITAEPLDMVEMMFLTGKDALITLGDFKCRILSTSPGQEIEVDYTYYDKNVGAWGLRKAKKPNSQYDYMAMKII